MFLCESVKKIYMLTDFTHKTTFWLFVFLTQDEKSSNVRNLRYLSPELHSYKAKSQKTERKAQGARLKRID
ncbi:hypothetical protein GCM10026983_36420 [Gracilibacillus alcaliphilus]